jgi:hypothetical protein
MTLASIFAVSLMMNQEPPKITIDHGTEWIGKTAKSVIVKDEDGSDVDLSKQYGKKPIVLIFYRAIW